MKSGDEVRFDITCEPYTRRGYIINKKDGKFLVSVPYGRCKRYYWKTREQLTVVKPYVPDFPTPEERIDDFKWTIKTALEFLKKGNTTPAVYILEKCLTNGNKKDTVEVGGNV